MKNLKCFLFFLFFFLFISNSFAKKETSSFVCPIAPDLKIEVSIPTPTTPTLSLFYKNSKYALCFYENTPGSHPENKRSATPDQAYRLLLKECTYYFEAHKAKIALLNDVTFITSPDRKENYLRAVESLQPLLCMPKK